MKLLAAMTDTPDADKMATAQKPFTLYRDPH